MLPLFYLVSINYESWIDDVQIKKLTFYWSSPFANCTGIEYQTSPSNCGSCSSTSSHSARSVCTNLPAEGGICTFRVWYNFCGITVENATNVILENISQPPLLPVLLSSSILVTVSVLILVGVVVVTFTLRKRIHCKTTISG